MTFQKLENSKEKFILFSNEKQDFDGRLQKKSKIVTNLIDLIAQHIMLGNITASNSTIISGSQINSNTSYFRKNFQLLKIKNKMKCFHFFKKDDVDGFVSFFSKNPTN